MNPEVLIIGCGFLGEVTAEFFSSRGRRVLGVVGSARSLERLAGRNFSVTRCDITSDESVERLRPRVQEVPLAIYAVSSKGGGAAEYAAVYRDGLRRVINGWNPRKLIFVSSTSVYGQDDGVWVTEESPALPGRETGKILLEAESLALAAGGIVARFTGIYGPGRSMLLRKFLDGEAVLEEGGGRYLNQIHRDDGAAALYHLGETAGERGIYNVTDDTPATQRELYGWIADFLNRTLPPVGPVDATKKRGFTSKRVSNAKLKSLGWNPCYRSYRDALPSLMV